MKGQRGTGGVRHELHKEPRAVATASTQGVCVSIAEGALISGYATPRRPSFYMPEKRATLMTLSRFDVLTKLGVAILRAYPRNSRF